MCLLQQGERLLELFTVDELDRSLTKLNQDQRYFIFSYFEFSVVVLAELVLQRARSFVFLTLC